MIRVRGHLASSKADLTHLTWSKVQLLFAQGGDVQILCVSKEISQIASRRWRIRSVWEWYCRRSMEIGIDIRASCFFLHESHAKASNTQSFILCGFHGSQWCRASAGLILIAKVARTRHSSIDIVTSNALAVKEWPRQTKGRSSCMKRLVFLADRLR